MSVIRVNPESVASYGRDAQSHFDQIHHELTALVAGVADVRYFGPNALAFKTGSAEMAADFANRFSKDIGQIADSIRVNTSNISSALGGQPININVNGALIQVPQIASSDIVDIDLTALESLSSLIKQHFTLITDHIDRHLEKLVATDCLGRSKEATVEAVRTFTAIAKSKCGEAQQNLSHRIQEQISAVQQADAQ